jgi:hypothetical protein
MKKTMMPRKEDSAEKGADLLVVGGKVNPLLHRHLLREALETRGECRGNGVSVFGFVETDDEVGDAIALQKTLRRGERDAEVPVIEVFEAGVDDADDLNVDAVESAIGGDRQNGKAVADLDAHGARDSGADEGFDLASGCFGEIAAGGEARAEAHGAFCIGVNGAAHEDGGFHAIGKHAVELDAGSDPSDVTGGADIRGDALPVADSSVEDMNFVATEVLGIEDLDMTEAVADGALTKAVKHEGEEPAHEEQTGNASADHEKRHEGAAAIAEDVTKC